jgi:PEP-CTERM motif
MNKNNSVKISMIKFASIVAVASTLLASTAANAVVLTFDDLPGTLGYIPNGYGGLQWDNFGSTNSSGTPGTGYDTGSVSGLNTAFNLFGSAASFSSATAFSLRDAFFTGAWNDGLQIHVVATGGSNTYTSDFTVDTSGPLNVFFNWSNINTVTFTSFGGIAHPGLNGGGTHFAMDNLAINEVASAVPEPETYIMLLAGLGFIGFMARRRSDLTV